MRDVVFFNHEIDRSTRRRIEALNVAYGLMRHVSADDLRKLPQQLSTALQAGVARKTPGEGSSTADEVDSAPSFAPWAAAATAQDLLLRSVRCRSRLGDRELKNSRGLRRLGGSRDAR